MSVMADTNITAPGNWYQPLCQRIISPGTLRTMGAVRDNNQVQSLLVSRFYWIQTFLREDFPDIDFV